MGSYWDAQERIGQVALSERVSLVVSLVGRKGAWYVRLQQHRHEGQGASQRSVPTERGLMLPVGQIGALVDLLEQARDRVPQSFAERLAQYGTAPAGAAAVPHLLLGGGAV
jgi:hypothetical protein